MAKMHSGEHKKKGQFNQAVETAYVPIQDESLDAVLSKVITGVPLLTRDYVNKSIQQSNIDNKARKFAKGLRRKVESVDRQLQAESDRIDKAILAIDSLIIKSDIKSKENQVLTIETIKEIEYKLDKRLLVVIAALALSNLYLLLTH